MGGASAACGLAPNGPCLCAATVTVERREAFPAGTVEQAIRVVAGDNTPDHFCTWDLALAVVPANSPSSAIPVVSIVPSRVILWGAGDEDTAIATLSIPAAVDASRVEGGHDGVYEMQATITAVDEVGVDELYLTNRTDPPSLLDPATQTVEIVSAYGVGVPEELRHLNGDLCIVPNDELPTEHGFHDATYAMKYMAYFGGHFLDANGDPSVANFSGRRIKENLGIPTGDPCFDLATETEGRNPMVDYTCADGKGMTLPEADWFVTEDDGTWGRCSFDHHMDKIGRGVNCAQAYIATSGQKTRYENPNVPSASDPVCHAVAGLTQYMQMDCRRSFYWSLVYTPVKNLEISYHFDVTGPWAQVSRGGVEQKRVWDESKGCVNP